MPAILDRDEGNARRKDRLAKQKKGPGVFVYSGEAHDTEWVPTILTVGKRTPVLDDRGLPIVDRSGRQVYERAGAVVQDDKGRPVMGGTPKVKRISLDVLTVRGVAFPAGKKVVVDDHALALKLRCMSHFEEVDADAAEVEAKDEAPAKPKRGRKAKAVEVEADADAES